MINVFIYLLSFVFFISCATPGTPLGGPQDTNPPIVQEYIPAQQTISFKGKDIVIRFDEWVSVENLKQNLIISPPLKEDPVVIAKKNNLTLHFKQDLDSNTTYSIFFGQAVKDNNEGNVIDNLQYVFSTGDYIDSLSIEGKVFTTDQTPIPENTFVQLYKKSEDSIISKERPLYIYKVGKEGNFKISFLPSDTFKLFVLNDLNTNYKYDLATEWVGKFDSLIYLDSNVKDIQIPIYLPEDSKVRVKDYNSKLKDGILTIEFNKELNPLVDTFWMSNSQSDTAILYNDKKASRYFTFFTASDSSSTTYTLSVNRNILDSIRVKTTSESHEKAIFLIDARMSFKNSILRANKNGFFSFATTYPIKHIDKSKIFIVSESDTLKIEELKIKDSIWGFSLQTVIPEKFKGNLFFLDSALQFYNHTFSDSILYEISWTSKEELSDLSLIIQLPSTDTSYVIRIFNKDNFFIDEIIVQGRDSINYMLKQAFPDEYFIEVIEDLNKSGTWNGASFWESRLPERVFRSQTYSARANWDDQHIIKVDFSQSTKITELTNPLELLKARYKQLASPSKQLRNDVGGDDDKNTPSNDFRPDFKKNR